MLQSSSILLVGGGAFGLSTAYHLSKAGYKNITLLEKSSVLPPEQSAGNDLNKIIRAEYEDPFYAELALEAIREWKTPLFSPHYHEVGYLLATSPAAPEKAKATLQRSLSSIRNRPAWQGMITPLKSRADISSVAPTFDGPMPWEGYFNRLAGYAQSADALCAVYSACCALGVDIHLGEEVTQLTFDGPKCTGAQTKTGARFSADTTIVAVGAFVPELLSSAGAPNLPSITPQIKAVGFPVAHIQLTPDEALRLRGIPVTYARDLGFFFEPERRSNLLKICPSTAGYTWFNGTTSKSVPPPTPEDSAFISCEDEMNIRELLRQTLPQLAERPLQDKRICWCADAPDTEYVVDYVPDTEGLVVVSGDSGHGFKMLPIFGRWVKELLDAGRQDISRWKWKHVELKGSKGDGDVSWRIGTRKDLSQIEARL